LNTDMNGMTVEIVASSWIEALGGLSICVMRSVPPDFCASDAPALNSEAALIKKAAAIIRDERVIIVSSTCLTRFSGPGSPSWSA
jgi:hypothetical protein